MNYQQAKIFLLTFIIIVVLIICGLILRPVFSTSTKTEPPLAEVETTLTPTPTPTQTEAKTIVKKFHVSEKVGNLSKQFNDLNDAHLVYAKKIGIRPINKTQDILKIRKPIVKVTSGDYYKIDNLTHSYPYLVEEAAQLLDTIAVRFNRKLSERSNAHYKLKVTSLLRTQESVGRLKRRNVNSTSNSAHLYATTFDISYSNFIEGWFNTTKLNNEQLKNLLAEVLLELREEGKCLVKFERKESCFHITATGK